MPKPQIVKEDLAPVLERHHGNAALLAAFEAAREPPHLLSVFARYIQFNSAFGAGVSNLAGQIASRQGIFRDPDEPLRVVADRASDVGSDFFYAAIDEFDDRATPWRDTHRTLAQATLKGMGAFCGYTPQELNDVIRVNQATEHAIAAVWEGYGIGRCLDEPGLFEAMGFHTGSEILADQEFALIDRHLREKRPELVHSLEATRIEILGEKHNAYYWIRIHTSVETEHFEAALRGGNKALRFYSGEHDPQAVKNWILDGFSQFAAVQGAFMNSLGEP